MHRTMFEGIRHLQSVSNLSSCNLSGFCFSFVSAFDVFFSARFPAVIVGCATAVLL